MIYILSDSYQPEYNVALEEYFFRKFRSEDKIFILWRNLASIIVGKHQNIIEELNYKYVREHSLPVVRRISGGGTVYHDLNNLNYTVIVNRDGAEAFDLRLLSQPLLNTLQSLGVKAELSERNDILIAGKKVCGNAQAYIRDRMMQHACLLFNADLEALSLALKRNDDLVSSRAKQSVRSEVDNISNYLGQNLCVEQFSDIILSNIKELYPDIREYKLTGEDNYNIEQLKAEKYDTWEWNYANSPLCHITRTKKFANSKFVIDMDINAYRIDNVKIKTESLDSANVQLLESSLRGCRYCREDITKVLNNLGLAMPINSLSDLFID